MLEDIQPLDLDEPDAKIILLKTARLEQERMFNWKSDHCIVRCPDPNLMRFCIRARGHLGFHVSGHELKDGYFWPLAQR